MRCYNARLELGPPISSKHFNLDENTHFIAGTFIVEKKEGKMVLGKTE